MEFLFKNLNPTDLGDPSTYAGTLYAIFIFLEITLILLLKRKGDYETRDSSASISMGLGSAISSVLVGVFSVILLYKVYDMRVMSIETTPLMLIILFFVDDYRFYWGHRLSHRVRWFWANHVVHHSSQHYNLSTALRQAWFNTFSGLIIIYIPFILMGVHPAAMIFVGSVNLLYQFFVHTETIGKFPRWIEAFMNTPSHHRVHHSSKPEHLDTNYAGVFIIWDRLHKTFVREKDNEAMQYGLVYNLGTFNPIRIATHEFLGIFKDILQPKIKLSQRLAYMFAPPGWSHDGSRKTSHDLKREAFKHEAVENAKNS